MKRKYSKVILVFLVFGIVGFVSSLATAVPKYIVTDINDLEKDCWAIDINNSGQVVGYCFTTTALGEYEEHPFLWTRQNGMIDLGNLGGKFRCKATSINNLGQVAGYCKTGGGETHAFLWTKENGMIDTFLQVQTRWNSDKLPYVAINDIGWIASAKPNALSSPFPGQPEAFLWTREAGFRFLGTGGRDGSHSLDINNAGQVVGGFYSPQPTPQPGIYLQHAFLWSGEKGLQDLGHLGGYISEALSINSLGEVVGWSAANFRWGQRSFGYDARPFLWTRDKGMVDLGAPSGSNGQVNSYAVAINNFGQIVGNFLTGEERCPPGWGRCFYVSHGFVWTKSEGMVDVGTFGGDYFRMIALNDRGEMAGGMMKFTEGRWHYHGVLLTPVTGVTIDIKPGESPNRINPKSGGKIPVAILSANDFNAFSRVDPNSLTFGRTGDEKSLALCHAEEINGDGRIDLACNFNTQDTGFQCGDSKGLLKGKTKEGIPIEGSDSVSIGPCK